MNQFHNNVLFTCYVFKYRKKSHRSHTGFNNIRRLNKVLIFQSLKAPKSNDSSTENSIYTAVDGLDE